LRESIFAWRWIFGEIILGKFIWWWRAGWKRCECQQNFWCGVCWGWFVYVKYFEIVIQLKNWIIFFNIHYFRLILKLCKKFMFFMIKKRNIWKKILLKVRIQNLNKSW
jgi:hypothetical protein